ncbi:MAG: glycosyltransferase family 2 protein [Thermoplasmata archaeon]|nr:glycosyltransferase family 2 protein [Thermoplasmata archaeon]
MMDLDAMTEEERVSVVVPTYNERENIEELVERIFTVFEQEGIQGEVVVVDDDSPDGTGTLAEELGKTFSVRTIIRKEERGLSSAVLKGFEVASGNILGVIDADLSHPPESIPDLVRPILNREADLVFGSRYMDGGRIENWPFTRRLISKGAEMLSKPLADTTDPMSGFFFLRRNVVDDVDLNPKGFKIGLEIIVKGNYTNLMEVPITFVDRKAGTSKLKGFEYVNYLIHNLSLLLHKKGMGIQFLMFSTVGALGVLVNMAVLLMSVEVLDLWYMIGALLAFLVAATHNYILNRYWTFGGGASRPGLRVGQYGGFLAISVVGLGINLSVLYALVEWAGLWYVMAQLFAILVALSNNFLWSKFLIFRED